MAAPPRPMSVGAAPRDSARRRQWGDAARRRRASGTCAGARRRCRVGGPGTRGALGRDAASPPPPTSAPPLRGPVARNRPRRTRTRLGPSPRRASVPRAAPHPRGRGATCSRRAGETGLGVFGLHWVTLGPHGGPVRTPADRCMVPRSGRADSGRGRGSPSRSQSGAGGVRCGPMVAREWALLGDRVMGRAAWRSLTPDGGARMGSLSVTATRCGRSSPTVRGRRARPRAPRSRPWGRGRGRPSDEWALQGARDANKGASLGRAPRTPRRAHAPALRLGSLARPPV